MNICLAFAEVIELCAFMGAWPANKHDSCWEEKIDDEWWIALNGHKEKRLCSRDIVLPPFACYVEYNGLPAGFFDPFGGSIVACEGANEQTFIAALQKRMKH